MTQSIALNAQHDIFTVNGGLQFVSGLNAAVQNCQTAMLTIQGEMMYDLEGGVPYPTVVWNNYRPNLFEAAARAVLLKVPDVTDILAFSQSLSNNVLSYSVTINTVYGIATFSNF